MARYQETSNPEYVLDTLSGAYVPRQGTYQSDEFNAWHGAGNAPDPMPLPSLEDRTAANVGHQRELLRNAALAMAPLQDAVDLGMATDGERSSLLSWKSYRVAVNRVDVTAIVPLWPVQPDSEVA